MSNDYTFSVNYYIYELVALSNAQHSYLLLSNHNSFGILSWHTVVSEISWSCRVCLPSIINTDCLSQENIILIILQDCVDAEEIHRCRNFCEWIVNLLQYSIGIS